MLPPYPALGDGGTFLAQSFKISGQVPEFPELSGTMADKLITFTVWDTYFVLEQVEYMNLISLIVQKDKGACNRKGAGSASKHFHDELDP